MSGDPEEGQPPHRQQDVQLVVQLEQQSVFVVTSGEVLEGLGGFGGFW